MSWPRAEVPKTTSADELCMGEVMKMGNSRKIQKGGAMLEVAVPPGDNAATGSCSFGSARSYGATHPTEGAARR